MWRKSKWSGVDVENERAEWMWTISEEKVKKKKFLKYTILSFCFVLMIM